jgi:predicted acylesterase/phospholipase RssA
MAESFEVQSRNLAYATYKDENLPAPHRFDKALSILKERCDLENTTDTMTLGLAGAIYKHLWHSTGRREDLERSLHFYEKGHELAAPDDGYTSLNAAFVLDLLAHQETLIGGAIADAASKARKDRASEIRAHVLAKLEGTEPQSSLWWYCANLAEAALGLGHIDKAARAIERGLAEAADGGEATARQLAALIRLRFDEDDAALFQEAAAMLSRVFRISETALQALVAGKLGLALSGGGFRASLFHIGVLAKLAELDLLRYVEVISAVSGGSIVAASYYLELKKRLERGPVSRADYIQIVRDVERKFLAGVQTNIRTSVAGNPFKSIWMALKPGYTRSDRIAELYEKRLYDVIADPGQLPVRTMSDLMVNVPGIAGFNPKKHNWRLDAKVPMLVLNATTLNTGHTWQFTATWMGESPQAINAAIDAIPRLRRRYYWEGTKEGVALARAVGASACVPGLFEPIALKGEYENRTVRLVDGGVHDNQGLGSLLELGCRVILVSDASGQMSEDKNPDGAIAAAVARSSSISQARVREAQYDQLSTLSRSGALVGSMFIHLTKDLDEPSVPFIGAPPEPPPAKVPEKTSYGIDRDIQMMLSKVRTDLDSFSDAEAYALMTSGYAMADQALVEQQCAPTLPIRPAPVSWSFLATRDALTKADPEKNARMKSLLSVSGIAAFRIWRQWLPLKILAGVLAIAALAALVLGFAKNWNEPVFGLRPLPVPTSQWVAMAAGAVVAAVIFRYVMDKMFHIQKRFGEFLVGVGLLAAWPVAWLHLLVFDKLFLWYGRWEGAPEQPVADLAPPGPMLPIKARPAPVSPEPRVPPPPQPQPPAKPAEM